MLTVRKQKFLGVESLGIFDGDAFVAYGRNRLRVHEARIEIERTLKQPVRRWTPSRREGMRMAKATLLNTTVEETMERYDAALARYAIRPAPLPIWRQILRWIFRVN